MDVIQLLGLGKYWSPQETERQKISSFEKLIKQYTKGKSHPWRRKCLYFVVLLKLYMVSLYISLSELLEKYSATNGLLLLISNRTSHHRSRKLYCENISYHFSFCENFWIEVSLPQEPTESSASEESVEIAVT